MPFRLVNCSDRKKPPMARAAMMIQCGVSILKAA